MKIQIDYWVRILVKIQLVTANFDPEVLQLPGGSLIASLLWIYVTARSFWSVCTYGSVALSGHYPGRTYCLFGSRFSNGA
jgi:hypothetical protein